MKKEKTILIEFTETELEHFSSLCKEASQNFGNNICNDYELENTDENWNFIKKYREHNGDNPLDYEPRPKSHRKIFFYDFMIMDYLAAKLNGEIK